MEVDEKSVVTSTGGLELDRVPGHLVVIGGGYIGLELGSVWRRLGAEVTVVEFLDRIVPGMDGEVGKTFERVLTKQGFKFRLKTKVTAARKGNEGVVLTVEPAEGGPAEEIAADVVLVAIGRRATVEGLGLDGVGVALDERGRVKVDGHFATNVPGIYAIGDAIAGPMLAHKAEEEGVAVAERIAGQAGHVNYEAIPGVVYTWPEVASVGRTEEQLKADGVQFKAGKFPFTANGRARAMGDTDGFVKILADARTDRLLGAHIIGPDAGTLIAELALAIEFGASAEDVARTCHAHPSLNEAVKEAALAVRTGLACVIPVVLTSDLSQCAHDPRVAGERGEASGLGAERVPGRAERVHDGLLAPVQAEGKVAFPQVQPDPFRRAQLGRVRRQRQKRDVGRHLQGLRAMPASLVEQERDVHVVGQGRGEAGEEQVHGFRRRLRQHQGEGVVGAGTDGGEDVGGEEALVAAPRRSLATGEPATAGASLLPLSGLVFTP